MCGTQYNMKKTTKQNKQLVKTVPVAKARVLRASPPQVDTMRGGIRIQHHEFCTTVSAPSSTAFQILSPSDLTPGLDINPGCAELFPWLSGISRLYEKFRFTNLKFTIVPSQPSTTAGKYYAAIDYDYDDDVPTTKVNMLTNHTTVQHAVWAETELIVDCALMRQNMDWRYTLTNGLRVGGVEPRTVYGGYLLVATDGLSAACSFDIWATYTVELSIERLDTGGVFGFQTQAIGPASLVVGATVTDVKPTVPTTTVKYPTILTSSSPIFPQYATTNQYQWVMDMANAAYASVSILSRVRLGPGLPGASILSSGVSTPALAVIDRDGSTLLDTLNQANTLANESYVARDGSTDPSVAGSLAELGMTVNWANLVNAYPTARFLAWDVTLGNALAAVVDVIHTIVRGSYL